jgi:hypothetical protein
MQLKRLMERKVEEQSCKLGLEKGRWQAPRTLNLWNAQYLVRAIGDVFHPPEPQSERRERRSYADLRSPSESAEDTRALRRRQPVKARRHDHGLHHVCCENVRLYTVASVQSMLRVRTETERRATVKSASVQCKLFEAIC